MTDTHTPPIEGALDTTAAAALDRLENEVALYAGDPDPFMADLALVLGLARRAGLLEAHLLKGHGCDFGPPLLELPDTRSAESALLRTVEYGLFSLDGDYTAESEDVVQAALELGFRCGRVSREDEAALSPSPAEMAREDTDHD